MPEVDEQPLPTPQEILDAYMARAHQALSVLFEATAGIQRLSQDRPELADSFIETRRNLQTGYLWLQNGASGVDKILNDQKEQSDEVLSDK